MKSSKTNTLSIIGFIVSIFSIVFGTIICLISISQIKESHEKGKGLALGGIIINLIKIFIVVLLFFILIIAPGRNEIEYKCKVSKNCTLNSDNTTYTCIYDQDGVEEYVTCNNKESKNFDTYGTEDNEDTFDYDRYDSEVTE